MVNTQIFSVCDWGVSPPVMSYGCRRFGCVAGVYWLVTVPLNSFPSADGPSDVGAYSVGPCQTCCYPAPLLLAFTGTSVSSCPSTVSYLPPVPQETRVDFLTQIPASSKAAMPCPGVRGRPGSLALLLLMLMEGEPCE